MKTHLKHRPSSAAPPKRRAQLVRRACPPRPDAAPGELARILVPVDFSAGSEAALRRAASRAQLHHARVLPIHVTAPICFTVDCGYGPVNRKEPDEDSLRQTRARLRKLVHRFVPAELAEEVTVCSGEPNEQIVRATAERKADLIIMLAHGALGRKSAAPTHTVDRLVRETRCPVLVVHACEPPRERLSLNRERTR